jgi:tetratricopeptide (TPR) repeat protein
LNPYRKHICIALMLVLAGLAHAAVDTKAFYEQGMDAYRTGNYGSSELLFRKIIDAGDDEYVDRAWFYLARSLYNKKKYDSSLFEFKSFLNKCKTDILAIESRYWMGECYYNISDYSNAIDEFRRFIARSKDAPLRAAAHDRIGSIYLSQKRYDEAVLEWESAASGSEDAKQNALRQYWIGDALFRNGRLDEALQKLMPLSGTQTDPGTAALVAMGIGRIYQEKGDHQKALQQFNSIPAYVLKEDQLRDLQYFKAVSYAGTGNRQQARSLFDAYLAAGKNALWYHNALLESGIFMLSDPNPEEGLKRLETVRAESNDPELKSRSSLSLGTFYVDRNPEKAVPYLEESLKTVKIEERNRLLIVLGKTYFSIKKYDKAAEVYNLYLKENPLESNRDEIQFMRGRVYLEMGEIDRAVDIFETIRKDNPFSKFNAESNYYLALVRYKKGDSAGAVALLKEYLKQKNSENAYDANLILLRIYIAKEDMASAGAVADVLTRGYLNRKDMDAALYDYATLLMKKGLDARKYINLILNRFPASEKAADLSFQLGNDNFSRGNFGYALEYYNKYLNSPYTKSRGDALYKKCLTLYNLKRYEDVTLLVPSGERPPVGEDQWREMVLVIARSYYRQKKIKEVYTALDLKNMQDYPKEDVLMYVRCALEVGDYHSAMEANEFLETDKQSYSESLYGIGEYLLGNGKQDEAELYFNKVINECPGTGFVDDAKLSLGEMMIGSGEYQDAVNIITDVADGTDMEKMSRKHALLIRCYFEMGSDDKAAAMCEQHLAGLASSRSGEAVFRMMVEYYYRKNDLQQFEKYAAYLVRYQGNEQFLNHLSGKIYFRAGNFYRAYNYYFALSRMKSDHADEACYFLGVYNMLVVKSVTNAVYYFTRVLDMQESDEVMKSRARVELSIIYREMNNGEKANELLKQVLSATQRGLQFVQASNLYEAFGGDGKK